jgi:hypothetical protein
VKNPLQPLKIAYKGDFKMELQEDIKFDAKITVQNRLSKNNNPYQVMVIGVENKKTGEILNIHEVYIKENLRQVIKFILDMNK